MANKIVISSVSISDTLMLSELPKGFWLYDTTRGMNIAMRSKTKDDAFIEALTYYQKRLTQVEAELKILTNKVGSFINQFQDQDGTPLYWSEYE